MPLNNFRNKSFWFLDSLKGNQVKNHLNEIREILDNPKSNLAKELKEQSLISLLSHVTTTTPFYYSYQGKNSLSDFPVIKKSVVQDNFESFKSSSFINDKNHKVSTSGSTGMSFFLFHNKNKRLRNYADAIYFYDNSGYKLGNRLYKLIVWHANNKKSKLSAWKLNMAQFDVSNFSDSRIEELINMLVNDKHENKGFICYSSALEQLAKYLDQNEIYLDNHGLSSIVSISEYLNSYTKTTLKKHLGIPIISRYSNEELGMMAQQTLNSQDSYKINHASYIVEVLNFDEDKPVAPGEFGRIVVTDLYNYAMPLLRYDTGDIATYSLDENDMIQLDQIEGRKMDVIYNTQGNIISSFITHAIFNDHYKHLQQYQFIQQGRDEYEIKLNIQGDSFLFEEDLINRVKKEIGSDANIKISYVDEIPTLSSGKRRKVINNYVRT
ncbi:MAG: CoF synthetase [bacterium]